VQKKHNAHQRNDDRLFKKRELEIVDSALDKIRAVVHRLDIHSFRQAGTDLLYFGLKIVDHGHSILAVAGNGDAADHLTLSIELNDAATLVRAEFDASYITQQNRNSA